MGKKRNGNNNYRKDQVALVFPEGTVCVSSKDFDKFARYFNGHPIAGLKHIAEKKVRKGYASIRQLNVSRCWDQCNAQQAWQLACLALRASFVYASVLDGRGKLEKDGYAANTPTKDPTKYPNQKAPRA